MRDEIRPLSTTVLRMDGSVQSMAQELGAISGLLAEHSPARSPRRQSCASLIAVAIAWALRLPCPP
jgi:hypothetical protein